MLPVDACLSGEYDTGSFPAKQFSLEAMPKTTCACPDFPNQFPRRKCVAGRGSFDGLRYLVFFEVEDRSNWTTSYLEGHFKHKTFFRRGADTKRAIFERLLLQASGIVVASLDVHKHTS